MNPTARPRFRTDLVAEPLEEGGHRYIDVFDPDTGNVFRFFDVEYSIACAMDGQRDVPGLAQWAKEELGVEPSSRELATVITALGDLGYLETGTTAPARTQVAYDDELAPGVVVAATPRSPVSRADDVELGIAGAQQARAETPITVEEVELGVAGGQASRAPAVRDYGAGPGPELGPAGNDAMFDAPPPPPPTVPPMARLKPVSRPDQEDDGPTNLPPAMAADFGDDDVSVDLSDHLAISASDVKEAVRASKVMRAVDLPSDMQAALDGADAQADEARRAAEKAAAEKAAAEKAAAEKVAAEKVAAEKAAAEKAAAEKAAAEKAAAEREAREVAGRAAAQEASRAAAERPSQDARPAVELPKTPVNVTRPRPETGPAVVQAKEPVAAEAGGSKTLMYLIAVVVLLAVIYAVWVYVLQKPLPWAKTNAAISEPPPVNHGAVAPPVAPPPAPPPPPPPSATLGQTAGAPADVVAGQAAQVAEVVADGKVVAAGDQLLRFVANAAFEQRLKGLDYDITTGVPKEIERQAKLKEKADATNNAAASKAAADRIDERAKRLEEKRKEREEILTKLEGAIVKAPVAGTVAVKAKKGTFTTATDVVATVTPLPVLTATFDVPAGKQIAVGAPARLAAKTAPDHKATCTVSQVEGSKVSVMCLADAGIAAGTDVVLE